MRFRFLLAVVCVGLGLIGVGLLAGVLWITAARTGRYEKALADYIQALKIDEGAVDGPSLVDRVIYGTPRPATVRQRAIYLTKQLALPEDQRVLRIPEKDAEQRIYKPY
jgi:hypothetical protein